LAAINGLISLATVKIDCKLLDTLIDHYSFSSKLNLEYRLKVGEVLTKTIRIFNELIPIYAPKLLNAFLIGCKSDEKEEFIKTSSLSNIGEVCRLLKFSLNDNINEILNCLTSILNDTNESINVKRSSCLVLRMIIEGLDKDTFIQVLGKSIQSVYKAVTSTKYINDDIISMNYQLMTQYINEMMTNSMFPKETLQKEIHILRPPI
jgi:hypothetical protein